MDIAQQPVTQHGADAGLGFLLQQVEERWHGIANRLPARAHIPRCAQIDRVIPVAGERPEGRGSPTGEWFEI